MRKPILTLFPLFLLMILSSGCKKEEPSETAHWDYEHATNWGTVGYPECNGVIQSPINIEDDNVVVANLPALVFYYSPFYPKIIDNTHTLQVNNNGTNTIVFQNKEYNFTQFHFHAHSEHQHNGFNTPVELHLVHSDPTSGALLVVGIWINSDSANTLIGSVLNNWPANRNKEITGSETINLNDLLPNDKNYYTYTGSLTTPPCSQGVTFVMLKQSITMSPSQIAQFANIYGHSWRPIQPLNNRVVYGSDL